MRKIENLSAVNVSSISFCIICFFKKKNVLVVLSFFFFFDLYLLKSQPIRFFFIFFLTAFGSLRPLHVRASQDRVGQGRRDLLHLALHAALRQPEPQGAAQVNNQHLCRIQEVWLLRVRISRVTSRLTTLGTMLHTVSSTPSLLRVRSNLSTDLPFPYVVNLARHKSTLLCVCVSSRVLGFQRTPSHMAPFLGGNDP